MSDEVALEQLKESGLDVFQDTVDEFLAAADVGVVYGEPIIHEDTLIIPTAEVLCVMGFGLGSGSGTDTSKTPENPSSGTGSGGGGGGRILSRPVAVVVASPEGVRVEPVVDLTKLALAALTAAGFMVGMMFRMSSQKHSLPGLED